MVEYRQNIVFLGSGEEKCSIIQINELMMMLLVQRASSEIFLLVDGGHRAIQKTAYANRLPYATKSYIETRLGVHMPYQNAVGYRYVVALSLQTAPCCCVWWLLSPLAARRANHGQACLKHVDELYLITHNCAACLRECAVCLDRRGEIKTLRTRLSGVGAHGRHCCDVFESCA